MQFSWIFVPFTFVYVVRTVTIDTFKMQDLCGTAYSSPKEILQISFKYSSYILHHDCKIEGWAEHSGFLIAFENVNFPTPDCKANLTLKKSQYSREKEIYEVKGIPTPLCHNNTPWATFPSPVYTTKVKYLEFSFQGGRTTLNNTGFDILLVSYYINALGCRQGEYQCDNHRCIPFSAHNCDGIDWCGDRSGCVHETTTDSGLIAGICAGIGVAVVAIVVIGCIVYFRRRKARRPVAKPSQEHAYIPTGNEPSHVTALTAPNTAHRPTQQSRTSPDVGKHEQQIVTHPDSSAPPAEETLQSTKTNNSEALPHTSEGEVASSQHPVSSAHDESNQRLLRNDDVTHDVQ